MRLIFLAILLLSGCASASLTVDRPLAAPLREVSLRIEGSDKVNEEQQAHLCTLLTSSLSKTGVAVRPEDSRGITLAGRIERYSPGNQSLRWLFGLFGAGGGAIESTWRVVDSAGKEIGSCRVDGSIHMGPGGGYFDVVLGKVGQRLGEFLSGSK